MEIPKDIHEVYDRFLKNQCTVDELQELFRYFGTSSETELLELIKSRSAELMSNELADDPERIETLGTIQSKIEKRLFGRKRKVIPFKYIVSVAAAILLTMVISLFLIRYKRTPVINEINTHIVQEDILPGGNKATLILSNGKTINLDEQKQEIIIGDSSLNYGDGTTLATTVNVETAILKTPRAGQYDIVLPDGTKVSLNAESSLEYPVKFTGSERRVKLNGEGYFEVAHDKSKPFHVETKNQDVQVLGTVFNIQSYTEKEATTLFSGKVHVENTTTKKSATLTPGQNAVATSTSLNVQNIDLHDFAMWKKGRFGGSSKSLIEVLTEIERWYDIDIKMNKNISNSERAYISISRKENLSVVLDGIGQTYGVNFQIKGKEVIIQPK
ncbi:DUF4974 domain-containing protein [Flavobacterium supellecticarium]|uniref:DUF4974 domain-containing protein n=1 Tax=Flavobacterium supellecticarium TaxID=2565924 RepID=A0A4S4A3X1_9FLAO|nr:DUF4974 domain-containing protein [Flavobacterium supellecticarium]